jgi:hypothetical protein
MNTSPSSGAAPSESSSLAVREPGDRLLSRRTVLYVGSVGLAFLVGWVPMWLRLGQASGEREAAVLELRRVRLQLHAASALIEARRGDYELARQSASAFFTALSEELNRGPKGALGKRPRAPFEALLQQRDTLITLLARSDAAATEQLSELYATVRGALEP